MNNLEKEVSNLDLSRQLKELGVLQESLFRWVTKEQRSKNYIVVESQSFQDGFSAFTTGELGELLPTEQNNLGKLTIEKVGNGWNVFYGGGVNYLHGETDENLANAMAQMLCYLLKNGLIKI